MMDALTPLLNLGLTPVPAPDENSERCVAELNNAWTEELRHRGVIGHPSAVTYWLPTAIAMAKVAGPPLFTVLGIWLQSRYGRKVRLKVGDIEAEARTIQEVEQLIARAQDIQQRNQPRKVIS
jgi:hypothetical protein